MLVPAAVTIDSTELRPPVPQMFADSAAKSVYQRANTQDERDDNNSQDHQADETAVNEHQVLHDRSTGIAVGRMSEQSCQKVISGLIMPSSFRSIISNARSS
jgi:hypothetical protein